MIGPQTRWNSALRRANAPRNRPIAASLQSPTIPEFRRLETGPPNQQQGNGTLFWKPRSNSPLHQMPRATQNLRRGRSRDVSEQIRSRRNAPGRGPATSSNTERPMIALTRSGQPPPALITASPTQALRRCGRRPPPVGMPTIRSRPFKEINGHPTAMPPATKVAAPCRPRQWSDMSGAATWSRRLGATKFRAGTAPIWSQLEDLRAVGDQAVSGRLQCRSTGTTGAGRPARSARPVGARPNRQPTICSAFPIYRPLRAKRERRGRVEIYDDPGPNAIPDQPAAPPT